MPNQRVKTDHYTNFGGVNTKASKYLTGPNEVLASFNNDGSSVGDFTGRPGSTQYFSATFANTGILGLSEYTKLNGYSKIMVAHPGGMWLGQDNTVAGISTGGLGSTQFILNFLNDAAFVGYQILQSIPSVTFGSSPWDYQTFVDHQFFCDGRAFLKFNGTTTRYWGLPDCVLTQLTSGTGGSFIGTTACVAGAAGASPGYYFFAAAWVNERGFVGPARVLPQYISIGVTQQLRMAVTFPITGFGITAMNIYSYFAGTGITNILQFVETSNADGSFVRYPADERFRLFAQVPIGSTNLGATSGTYVSTGAIPTPYFPFGQTNITNNNGTFLIMEGVEQPKFTELYKNMLFWSGSSQNPSSCYFSDIGEPEGWQPEWEFEFRTNDGDKITAMKTYGNRLVVGKELSLHELTGDDPETFFPREISTDYGILNNRACCAWEGRFWFIDRHGIAEYAGGLPKIVSEKVEAFFKRMNLSVAKETAQMIYMKHRNEVWTLIPIDGATKNNLLVIFDTISNQWYFWDGPNISIMAKMIGRMGSETAFFGDYSNRVNTFGTSFMGDNGVGFTQLIQFRYESPLGNSVEKLFRKTFVDAESMAGNVTLGIDIKLRADYGTSYQVGTTLAFTSNQEALQFGIPAKSLSVEISYFSAVDSMRLHGYALEHRWLRNS